MSGTSPTKLPGSHPADCAEWRYEKHPDRRQHLTAMVRDLLLGLRTGGLETRAFAMDSRVVHERLFKALTPPGYEYYAGHYRGEPFRCLWRAQVHIKMDPRVGSPPEAVEPLLAGLASRVGLAMDALDADHSMPRADRLNLLIALTAATFEYFLRVHPYLDGNGHVARFMVWCVLGRYGFWPVRFTVEPRPPDLGYSASLNRYRDGDHAPLHALLVSMLVL
jgi:hypothetical protein